MYTVGLTGGIGSGKSVVSETFAELGVPVIDADVIAREVVQKNSPVLRDIAEHFGASVINSAGELDRAQLRELVFSNPQEKRWLENLLHPLIRQEIIHRQNNTMGDYVLLVSPLLIETDQKELVDRILVVDVPESLQLQRAMLRDNNSEEQIRAIMSNQISRQERNQHADDIVLNDQDIENLKSQVQHLHVKYLALAKQPH